MTRAERIAERIRSIFVNSTDKQGDLAYLCTRFDRGDFDDLIGPEVSAEVLDDLEYVRQGSRWVFGHAWNCLAMARDMSPSFHVGEAMRYRRLAKFMRKLEQSCNIQGESK